MEGMVLGVDAEEGVIRTADGGRYKFGMSDWKSPRPPQPRDRVDFVADDGSAREVYLVSRGMGNLSEVIDDVRKSEKTMPAVVYACYVGALLWGVTLVIGVAVAYVYRGSANGTVYRSHYDYQISIFWKAMLGFLVGGLLLLVGVGMVILIGTYIWLVVKTIRGWRSLNEGKPVPPG